jgi:hypothetical protein
MEIFISHPPPPDPLPQGEGEEMSKLPTPLRKGIKGVKVPPPLAGGG